MMCAAPAYHSTQHWFLLVVTLAFLGTIFFSLYHLCLDTYLKTVNIGWLPTVSILFPIGKVQINVQECMLFFQTKILHLGHSQLLNHYNIQ